LAGGAVSAGLTGADAAGADSAGFDTAAGLFAGVAGLTAGSGVLELISLI
jgi:hypothetical protein